MDRSDSAQTDKTGRFFSDRKSVLLYGKVAERNRRACAAMLPAAALWRNWKWQLPVRESTLLKHANHRK